MLKRSVFCLALVCFSSCLVSSANAFDYAVRFLHWDGEGVFIPANIGKAGSPGMGIIIGDGSGLAPYPGPDGNNFRLNGWLQPLIEGTDDTDRHYGAIQFVTSGKVQPDGSITWIGKDGPVSSANPPAELLPPGVTDGNFHICQTELGNVYFKKHGIVRLSADGTQLDSGWSFLIVGGTGDFKGARGWLYATAKTLQPIPPNFDPANGAPFAYTFDGFILMKK